MLTRFAHLEPPFGVFDELARRLWEDWDVAAASPEQVPNAPRLELRDAGDRFIVTLDVPGLNEGDLALEVKGAVFTLSAERKLEAPKGYQARRQERPVVQFTRTITLPCPVDADATTASLKDGVLTVTFPKTPEAKPRAIPVRAGGAS